MDNVKKLLLKSSFNGRLKFYRTVFVLPSNFKTFYSGVSGTSPVDFFIDICSWDYCEVREGLSTIYQTMEKVSVTDF